VKLRDFDYSLPEELIAQLPLPSRDQSRMMVVRREELRCEHRFFRELPDLLAPQSFLVVNNTRVFPARLWARRPGKEERIEILLTREEGPGLWVALIKPARKAARGQLMELRCLQAEVVGVREDGRRLLRFDPPENLLTVVDKIGEPPLPGYILRNQGKDLSQDSERYQTVFASHQGSIAAPTAGLHFTPEVLQRLDERGVPLCEILLHVGYGTFQPVRCDEIEDHRIEPEYFEVSEESAAFIRNRKNQGNRLIAVGTTTTRTLEYLARLEPHWIQKSSGWCDLFIYPGFQFRVIDGLLTNFHLPRSTLLMLVCAFGGREFMLECYREAVSRRYRFFSYGDCMLIL
jgi:S-adenosylmethionine:tRNA ribosyltransferase-isomerase